MVGPLLVGYDGSEASKLALDHAARRALAEKREVVVCNVVPANVRNLAFSELLLPGLDVSKLVDVQKFEHTARKRLEEVVAALAKRGVKARAMVRAGDTADEMLAVARDEGADEIVLGFKSYEQKLPYGVGSVAEKVMRYAGCTVTIVRAPAGHGNA